MPPTVPQSIIACVIHAEDVTGILNEMKAVASEGLRVVLDAEQAGRLIEAMKRDAMYDGFVDGE